MPEKINMKFLLGVLLVMKTLEDEWHGSINAYKYFDIIPYIAEKIGEVQSFIWQFGGL